jgi:phytoene dehydrogenase-like protein
VRGVWGYVRAGWVDSVTRSRPAAAKEKGAEIKVNAPVARILTNSGRAAEWR